MYTIPTMRLLTAEIAIQTSRLHFLDEAWTRVAERGESAMSHDDLFATKCMVADMQALLQKLTSQRLAIVACFKSQAFEIDEAFRSMPELDQLDDNTRNQLSDMLNALPLSVRIVSGLEEILPQLSEEERLLKAKLDEMSARQITEGDLSHRAKCILTTAAAGACAVTPGFQGAALGLAAGALWQGCFG